MSNIDVVIKNFDEFIELFKKDYDESKANTQEKFQKCQEIINSKNASKETKLLYALIRREEISHTRDLAAAISLLHNCQIMTAIIQILENSQKMLENQFNIFETQILTSGILEKSKDIDDIKQLKIALKKIKAEREKQNKETNQKIKKLLDKKPSYID